MVETTASSVFTEEQKQKIVYYMTHSMVVANSHNSIRTQEETVATANMQSSLGYRSVTGITL